MCKHGTTTPVRVHISAERSATGKARWAMKPVDRCIAPIVRALTEAGIYTSGSCCGHGEEPGEILLEDGRALVVDGTMDRVP